MLSFKKLLAVFVAATVPVTALSPAHAATSKTPSHIISLSPSATEILWGIGAAKQVIAVDDNSNFPTGVPTSKLSSYAPNVEAIAAYKPDLVVLNSTATKADSVAAALKQLGVKVYLETTPTTIAGAYREFAALGKITGHAAQAGKLVASMKSRIAAIRSSFSLGATRTFIELDNTLYSATSKTFLGAVLKDFGAVDIADAAAGADASGYPQLSAEYLVKADPQLILLTDADWGESKATVAARAGWAGVDAVKNGKIYGINSDVASRWGPRLVKLYSLIGDALAHVKQ